MASSELTMKEAEQLVPVSRTTFFSDKKSGKFSVKRNARGKTVVDYAELERFYGTLNKFPIESNEVQKDKVVPKETASSSNSSDIRYLKEQIELLKEAASEKENIYKEQLDDLREALKRAQEGQNRMTLLLEDKSSKEEGNSDNWKDAIEDLKKQIANQETEAKNKAEEEKQEKEALKKQNEELIKLIKDREAKEEKLREDAAKKAEEEEAERIRKEKEELEAAQTWVSKMFGKKKSA